MPEDHTSAPTGDDASAQPTATPFATHGHGDHDPHTFGAAVHRQIALILTLVALVVVIGIALAGAVPLAGRLLTGLLLVVAFVRLVVPVQKLGALAVRARGIDVTFLLILAVGIGVLSGAPNL